MTRRRLVGSVDPVAVDRAGAQVAQVAVPDLVGVLEELDALELPLAPGVEEAELHAGGVRGEEREVDPEPVPGGAQRVREAFGEPGARVGHAEIAGRQPARNSPISAR